jgi:hypothetical protein
VERFDPDKVSPECNQGSWRLAFKIIGLEGKFLSGLEAIRTHIKAFINKGLVWISANQEDPLGFVVKRQALPWQILVC